MSKRRFAVFGAGFWSRFQLAGWQELDGAECVALYNRTLYKAEALARECLAAAAGEAKSYPFRPPRVVPRLERRVVALVSRRGRLLMFRRAADEELMAGFWELPWVVAETGKPAAEELARRYGGQWRLGERLAGARHAITTRRIEAELWAAVRRDGDSVAEGPEAGWHAYEEIDGLPTGGLDVKLLRAVAGGEADR